jgi:hypothetical protein
MSSKIMTPLLALLAVAAFAVMPAMASAATVTLHAGGVELPAGSPLVGESANLVFVTGAGNLECSSNVITGELTSNKKATIAGNIETGSFTGLEGGGACHTTTPLGRALITASDLPWPLTFKSNGTSTVKGSPSIVFTAFFPGAGVTCVYKAAKLAATFAFNEAPLIDTVTGQVFKYVKAESSVLCPKEGALSGGFAVTSGGEAVEATTP